MYALLTLLAYLIDMTFGEFRVKHPVVFMGQYISWFENKFYKNSVIRGLLLTLSLLFIVYISVFILLFLIDFLPDFLAIFITALIASTGIATNMLFSSVKSVLDSDNQKEALSMLVSRDTQNMSQSDINKALVETYAENISDGVVAPLFYLLLFGLIGIAVYKAINTLDSMVGYKTSKYTNYGKFSARLDDIANYIPARVTALIFILLSFRIKSLKKVFGYASGHESPNAGYPISAMAEVLDISLGGPASYHGKVKEKPFFGEGREEITKYDVLNALGFRGKIDIFLITILALITISGEFI